MMALCGWVKAADQIGARIVGRLRLRSLVQLIDSDGLGSAKFFGVIVGHRFSRGVRTVVGLVSGLGLGDRRR